LACMALQKVANTTITNYIRSSQRRYTQRKWHLATFHNQEFHIHSSKLKAE
jgi:hypothetical protein